MAYFARCARAAADDGELLLILGQERDAYLMKT